MIALLRRLLSREGLRSELKQMRANHDYWREEVLRLQEQIDALTAPNRRLL